MNLQEIKAIEAEILTGKKKSHCSICGKIDNEVKSISVRGWHHTKCGDDTYEEWHKKQFGW